MLVISKENQPIGERRSQVDGAECHARPHFHLVAKGVDDGNVGIDFDGLSIQDRGAIAPQANGGERRRDEEWVAGDDFERFHQAVGTNNGVEFDAAFVARLPGQCRIFGLDASGELGHLLKLTDFVTLFLSRRVGRWSDRMRV